MAKTKDDWTFGITPQEPGYYWCCDEHWCDGEYWIVHVMPNGTIVSMEQHRKDFHTWYWWGPIDPPPRAVFDGTAEA